MLSRGSSLTLRSRSIDYYLVTQRQETPPADSLRPVRPCLAAQHGATRLPDLPVRVHLLIRRPKRMFPICAAEDTLARQSDFFSTARFVPADSVGVSTTGPCVYGSEGWGFRVPPSSLRTS